MLDWSSEQATSLQAMITVSVNQAVAAIIKTSINDAVNQIMTAFEARNTSLDQQIQTLRYTRFARTPSVTPQLFSKRNNRNLDRSPHRSPLFDADPSVEEATTVRWKEEELRTFDSTIDDVYTFIDHINQVVDLRSHRLVQLNFNLQLRDAAKT